MRTILKISIILFLLVSSEGIAQTFNLIEAYTDPNCVNVTPGFKISKGNIAYNFDLKIVPEWSQCSDNEEVDHNMVAIRSKVKRMYLYQCYYYRNGEIKESSDLSSFVLGPGEYELVISENRGNSVRLTYSTGSDVPVTLNQK